MSSTTEVTKHNGWTNYETWLVACWLDDDQATSKRRGEIVADAMASENDNQYMDADQWRRYAVQAALKDWVEDAMIPDLGSSLASDLLSGSFSEIDWYDLARSYIADAEREVS